MLYCYGVFISIFFFIWFLVSPFLPQGKLITTLIVIIDHIKKRLYHTDTDKVATVPVFLARDISQGRE
jgi:hypothetical protein